MISTVCDVGDVGDVSESAITEVVMMSAHKNTIHQLNTCVHVKFTTTEISIGY